MRCRRVTGKTLCPRSPTTQKRMLRSGPSYLYSVRSRSMLLSRPVSRGIMSEARRWWGTSEKHAGVSGGLSCLPSSVSHLEFDCREAWSGDSVPPGSPLSAAGMPPLLHAPVCPRISPAHAGGGAGEKCGPGCCRRQNRSNLLILMTKPRFRRSQPRSGRKPPVTSRSSV